MTLPAGPPLTLRQIQQEFSAPSGTALSAFVRGGAWVPDAPPNAGVPTTLPISIRDLYGASAQVITINIHTITGTISDPPNPATTGIRFTRGGNMETVAGSVAVPAFATGEWSLVKAVDIGDAYEIRATQGSGSPPDTGPALGTWWPLSTDREWAYSNNSPLPFTTVNFEIRLAGGSVLDSGLQTFELVAS